MPTKPETANANSHDAVIQYRYTQIVEALMWYVTSTQYCNEWVVEKTRSAADVVPAAIEPDVAVLDQLSNDSGKLPNKPGTEYWLP